MKDIEIKKFITGELCNFEFIRISMGYRYLIDAILICIKDPNAIDNLNQNVFPKIAEKYNVTSYIHIKWCIEQLIKTMYNNTNSKVMSDYFMLDEDKKPTLKYIIYTIVTKYEWKYEN